MTQYIDLVTTTIAALASANVLKPAPSALELEESIRQRGLIHPPTFREIDGDSGTIWQLIVGERRTTAMRNLHKKGVQFYHDGRTCPPRQDPSISPYKNTLDASPNLKQVEFDENQNPRSSFLGKTRPRLPPKFIDFDYFEENPTQFSLRRRLNNSSTTRQVETNTSAHALAQRIQRATAITENLSNPTIAKARNRNSKRMNLYHSKPKKEKNKCDDRVLAVLSAEGGIAPITI